MKIKKISYWLSVVTIGIVLGISLQFVRAWVEPGSNPPDGNVGAPINVSDVMQDKAGPLRVTGFRNFNATILDGSVGIKTLSVSSDLSVDIEGKVGAIEYCDQNGENCVSAADLWNTVNSSSVNSNNMYTKAGSCYTGDTVISYRSESRTCTGSGGSWTKGMDGTDKVYPCDATSCTATGTASWSGTPPTLNSCTYRTLGDRAYDSCDWQTKTCTATLIVLCEVAV